MSNEGSKPSDVAADFTNTWRYKLGLGLFVLGQVALVVGILLPVLKLAPAGHSGLVGVLIVGGELVGLELAEFLSDRGRTVTVVDEVPRFVSACCFYF